MALFTGTSRGDTINFDSVSRGVVVDPAGAVPSDRRDTILGLGGDDVLHGGFGGPDSISGGDGNDTITGDGTLRGDAGNDVIATLGLGDTTARGGAGNDRIEGYADAGTLKLYGDGGDDWLMVNSDDGDPTSVLYGGAGNDTLLAASNFDNAPTGLGTDRLEGGGGNDTYVVFEASDAVVEVPGGGIDTVQSWADLVLPENVENLTLLSTGYISYGNDVATGNDLANVIRGNVEDNRITGRGGDDTLYGREPGLPPVDWYGGRYDDADTLRGGEGNDTLYGGDGLATWDGNDALYGDAGADVLVGQAGADTLSGGGGADVYRYTGIGDSRPGAADTILDFTGVGPAAGDRIDLSAVDGDATKGGRQAFTFVTADLTRAGQLNVVEGSGGASVVQGEVDGKKGIDFAIVVNDAGADAADWTPGDFIL